ncbi:elongation factor P hydroxylase [Hydrogenovibrio sp. 3SP14C1]|uniref:elongation factor P hydroxylase n=1 Tax=Hydrogenovibrio sp. 3SP14C1 TaxID=3038774 RepID=UPI002415A8DE|nr:elongation factor P hydroxylase [Hydrogenovibrio sp. 3SP14C1]MDG4813327.1 elongation factor P hydroxylase [Hydrogenovibrio sp. 3SP14C1]
MTNTFDKDTLISLFNQTFLTLRNTQLVCCEDEPIYRPADPNNNHPHHRIIFAHGFFASALHETAHWCVAGSKRRLLEDFGYWYQPDGRSPQQQAEFERVEIKPQALEWIFSLSAGFPFVFSADNLAGNAVPSKSFQQNVLKQVGIYLTQGMPEDAQIWSQVLLNHYQPEYQLSASLFKLPS